MGKYIGQIYKHSQSQISTSSLKTPVSLSSEPQTSPAIELTIMSIPSVTDKNRNNYVLYSQNTIQNDATITNNDNVHSCEAEKKDHSIPTISTHNHHSQHIATTSSSRINLNKPTKLPPVGK